MGRLRTIRQIRVFARFCVDLCGVTFRLAREWKLKSVCVRCGVSFGFGSVVQVLQQLVEWRRGGGGWTEESWEDGVVGRIVCFCCWLLNSLCPKMRWKEKSPKIFTTCEWMNTYTTHVLLNSMCVCVCIFVVYIYLQMCNFIHVLSTLILYR